MDNTSGQRNLLDIYNKFAESELTYRIIIFILPLVGLISSSMYTSVSSSTWYSNIRFTLPDISNKSYGLYISMFIYLIAGGALILIYNYNYKRSGDIITEGRGVSYNSVFPFAYYLIPILFLLLFLANPIMLQSQSLLAPGIIYIFVSVLALIILYVTFQMENSAKWFWLVFVIWIIYLTIFYFSSIGNTGAFNLFGTKTEECTEVIKTTQSIPINSNSAVQQFTEIDKTIIETNTVQ
jgi:hypothetical protein